jgi:hypothetical protein
MEKPMIDLFTPALTPISQPLAQAVSPLAHAVSPLAHAVSPLAHVVSPLAHVVLPLAQAGSSEPSAADVLFGHLIAAIVFSIVGIVVFFGSLWLMEKLTPFSIVKEIDEEHNQALAIIVGAIVLGISVIIAAAILG